MRSSEATTFVTTAAMPKFHGNAFRGGKEKEAEQRDHESDGIRHQKRDRKIHIRRRAFRHKMVERAGANSKCDGKVKEGHSFVH